MQTDAALLWGVEQKWEVETIDLGEPQAGEVLVKVMATGLCHSDHHYVTGETPSEFPIVGGHEGAGVVEAIGPGVKTVAPGDHVVLAFIPPCGRCVYCASGRANLCALSRYGRGIDAPLTRFQARGQSALAMGGLGTFSQYTVVEEGSVIKIDEDVSFEAASLLGCAVTTGWGSSVYLAQVKPGDNVIVVGAGGVGLNAIQGAHNAGADIVLAIDTNEFKQAQAKVFGATHTASSFDEARETLADLTGGRLADAVVICISVASGSLINDCLSLLDLGGIAVVAAVADVKERGVDMSLFEFTLSQKTLRGDVYGGVNIYRDIPLLIGLYKRGKLKLDELVTSTYSLPQINEGYDDMLAGKNLRGVVIHSH